MYILFNNDNNNEVYCHNNKSYKAKFVGDTKTLEICFNASTCFCLSLFKILCMDGIADCNIVTGIHQWTLLQKLYCNLLLFLNAQITQIHDPKSYLSYLWLLF